MLSFWVCLSLRWTLVLAGLRGLVNSVDLLILFCSVYIVVWVLVVFIVCVLCLFGVCGLLIVFGLLLFCVICVCCYCWVVC